MTVHRSSGGVPAPAPTRYWRFVLGTGFCGASRRVEGYREQAGAAVP